MNWYIFGAITLILSLIIAVRQRIRGVKFWPSFFKSIFAVAGVLGTIWKIIS